jgi:hypothetical protein
MREITSGERRLNLTIVVVCIIAVIINLFLSTRASTLIGLSVLLIFLTGPFYYNFNFISVFIDESEQIILMKGGKKIDYLRINKIFYVPIINRLPSGPYFVFVLKYTNVENKVVTRFISVPPKNGLLIDRLKQIININEGTKKKAS